MRKILHHKLLLLFVHINGVGLHPKMEDIQLIICIILHLEGVKKKKENYLVQVPFNKYTIIKHKM